MFQNYALFPHLDIFENVAFGLQRRGVKSDATRRSTTRSSWSSSTHFAKRKPAQLSGGQQQRVALARAIVNRPEVLLLDEPLGALDLKLRRQMQLELKRIQTEVGLTFVHVTHDQEEAMTMADTVAVMNKGRIEQLGAPGRAVRACRAPRSSRTSSASPTPVAGTVRTPTATDLVVDVARHAGRRSGRSRSQVHEGEVLFGVRPEKVTVSRTAARRRRQRRPGRGRATCRFSGVRTSTSSTCRAAGR